MEETPYRESIGIYLKMEQHRQLAEMAKGDDRSRSQFLALLIKKEYERRQADKQKKDGSEARMEGG